MKWSTMRMKNKYCLVSDTLIFFFNNFYSVIIVCSLILFVGVLVVSVRQSGRLSSRHLPKVDNEMYETIDLTIDGDSEYEQGIS